jgi:site-specific recombinase XerD
MKTTQTFSILIWANNARITSEGRTIWARITIAGKRAEFSLKKRVPIEKWDPDKGYMKGSSEEAKIFNNYINQVKSEIYKLYTEMLMLDEFVSAESLKLRFTGGNVEKRTILQVFDYHNEQLEKVIGIDVVRATLVKFNTIRTKLASFIKFQYKRSDFYLEELNHQFVSNFEFYLKTQEKIQHNTTMKYIQGLKKIVHIASRNQWLSYNPFEDFHCTFRKVERDVLTIEEIHILETKKFRIARLQVVSDLFVFSCYTGLAYIDVMRLTSQNLSIGIDGEYWLFTERKKTGEKVRIPLLPQALSILEKYKNTPSCLNAGSLLPKLSNQKLNSYLKEVADTSGIEKNLTFHLARHTFATTITLTNGVPIETVSKLLGHSSIKTTQIYAKVIERKISEDMGILKTKLTNLPKKKVSNC